MPEKKRWLGSWRDAEEEAEDDDVGGRAEERTMLPAPPRPDLM